MMLENAGNGRRRFDGPETNLRVEEELGRRRGVVEDALALLTPFSARL